MSNPIKGIDFDKLLLKWDDSSSELPAVRKAKLYNIIRLAKTHSNHKCVADGYRRLGTLFIESALLDSAIKSLVTSIKIADSINYKLSSASSNNELAAVYYELNNNTMARLYFQKAFELYKTVEDIRGQADVGFNLANISFETGNISEAETYNSNSILNRRKNSDTFAICYNYDLLSRLFLKKGAVKKALEYSRIAVSQFTSIGDLYGLSAAQIQYGDCFEYLNQTDSAIKFYREAYSNAGLAEITKWQVLSSNRLAEAFEKTKFQDSSIKYLKLQSIHSDRLHDEKITSAAIDASVAYETEKKEAEIIYQKEISARQKKITIMLSFLAISLIVALILLLSNFAQRKKIARKENELQNANAMLQGQDAERERIARELHDSVGSMISTAKMHFTAMDNQLVELLKQYGQSHQIAIELLDKTYEEVRRISHDLDTGLLGRYGFRTAMFNLVQGIEKTKKIKIQFIDNDLEPELYKNHETNLYRITQELITNTIKYADATEVSIQISKDNENLVYSYEDDGKGFDKTLLQNLKGIGFKNIEARVKSMKALLHIDTSVGNGINVIIEIPLNVNQPANS